jgi:AcrR family transcriptional regulator
MSSNPPRRGRPPVSTREALEEIAFELLLRDGYEQTTIQAIMAAGGVGRTTFFRYFGSKGGIVWGEFDRAVERLRDHLDDTNGASIMSVVVTAVVESTRLSREAAPDTWLDRFRVMDRDSALSGETAEHWRIWADTIAAFVAERAGVRHDSVAAAAIGGAVQAVYVTVLRRWIAQPDAAMVDVDELERELLPVGTALENLLPRT